VATAANVADSTVLADLLHGEETRVWGDQAYRGQTEVIQACAPLAQDHTHRRYRYKNGIDEQERAKNRTKSSVRSKGGAPVSSHEGEIRICEGALPRTEKERASAVCHLWVGQEFISQPKEAAVGDQRITGRRRSRCGERRRRQET
jgi:IS5 family transposase